MTNHAIYHMLRAVLYELQALRPEQGAAERAIIYKTVDEETAAAERDILSSAETWRRCKEKWDKSGTPGPKPSRPDTGGNE